MTDISPALNRAQDSTGAALADLQALAAAATQAQARLTDALRSAQRAASLSAFDQAALQDFLSKPYLVRPLSDGQYELIVPTFIGFRAGWPIRHSGPYSVFQVSRFINFINPLPGWLASELGFGAPSFGGTLDGNVLSITSGDPAAVAEKLGKAVARREGRTIYLRPASRFDVLRRVIREEGFLPFAFKPIPHDLIRPPEIARDEAGKPAFTMRPHQQRDYARFLDTGAVSVFAYPQTGKSYLPLQACAELTGPKLIMCPRRSLVDQWRARLQLFLTPAAAAEVTVTTYQGAAKLLEHDWTLVVFDEAHHLPADFAIESASRIHTVSRMGLSATPRREDGNEDLIPALCGFPVGADWPISASQRPTVTVWICKDQAEKLRVMKSLAAAPIDGKTFVFTFGLDIGDRAAKVLGVPFVYGKTKRPLEIIDQSDTVVISSIGNEGLSFPVRRVIEIDFLFGSGMEAGQRLGRLAYEVTGKDRPGEHHVLMTADEYQRYSKRLLIYEQWGLEIDVRTPAGAIEPGHIRPAAQRPQRPVVSRQLAAVKPSRPAAADNPTQPPDEVSQALALPAISAKIAKAQAQVGGRTAPYVTRAFRLCFAAALSANEIAEGMALRDVATISRFRSACKALLSVGLFTKDGHDRYSVSQDEVRRLRALSQMTRRNP